MTYTHHMDSTQDLLKIRLPAADTSGMGHDHLRGLTPRSEPLRHWDRRRYCQAPNHCDCRDRDADADACDWDEDDQ